MPQPSRMHRTTGFGWVMGASFAGRRFLRPCGARGKFGLAGGGLVKQKEGGGDWGISCRIVTQETSVTS